MKHAFKQVTIAILATLTACGGGGGGTSSTSTPSANDIATLGSGTVASATTTTLKAFETTSTIVTSVATPTYAQGSQQLEVFNLLNKERLACGFGALSQNLKIDTAAQGHSDWLVTNNYIGHGQVAGTPGFTGVTIVDRLDAVGYKYGMIAGKVKSYSSNQIILTSITAVSEVAKAIGGRTADGVEMLRNLLNAPFHGVGLMRDYNDVGIGLTFRPSLSSEIYYNTSLTQLIIDYGTTSNVLQSPPSGTIRTYPCEGTTGVDIRMISELPNPAPNHAGPIGSSIVVRISDGHELQITSASMVNVADGTNVTVLPPVTGSTDTNYVIWANEGFIMADTPMQPNTKYQATINGTDDGKAFSRTFSFTTGTGG